MKINKNAFFVFFLLLSISNQNLHCELHTEQRDVDFFDKIYVSGPGKLIVKQGTEACSVEAKKATLPLIKSVAVFKVLYLLNNSNQETVTFTSSSKNVSLIEISETITLEMNNFTLNDSLLIRISSSHEKTHKLVLKETPHIENASIAHYKNALDIKSKNPTKTMIKKLIVTVEKN